MAEQHVLINEIVSDHAERMLNLRKYYPFFVLCQGTLSQYKEGKFAELDMGYITLAVLRFFIDENNFNDRPVEYQDYEKFMIKLLERDFDITAETVELTESKELAAHIFNKINNDGKAFSFSFYDPESRKKKTTRIRLIESNIVSGNVVYYITADGIEFYLDTKEVRDESRISTSQLLLEKLIKTENFRGGIDVVKRINNEVSRLKKRRKEVISLMASDVRAGSAACDEFMSSTARWFQEERQSFEKNKNLADKAVARIRSEGGSSKRFSEINELMTELKKAIINHSELIAETAELSKLSEEMINRAKYRSLRQTFDFEDIIGRIVRGGRPADMGYIVRPFLMPKIHKSFAPMLIDNMLKGASDDGLKGEQVDTSVAELSFKFEDEKLDILIGHNFGMLFTELLDRLKRWNKLTLKEFVAILEVKFGEEIYDNRDFYSFLVHLAEKESYSMKKMLDKQETVLEGMVVENMTDSQKSEYSDMNFSISFDNEEIVIRDGDAGRMITNMIFTTELA